jgi:glycosyltransferase involved in cell wall biosynthesis
MHILYDGWSLLHQPTSPESLHLQAILANLPDEINPLVALPETAPGWLGDFEFRIHPTPASPFGRLSWEQVQLPRLARRLGINLLHLTSPTAPVLGNLFTLLSPCSFGAGMNDYFGIRDSSEESNQILTRLRLSLAHGGIIQVKEILWPLDLPAPELPGSLVKLPPIVPPDFMTADDEPSSNPNEGGNSAAYQSELFDLPETFIIYQGPGDRRSLDHLLQAWKWAAPAIGDYYPLLLVGLERAEGSKLVEHYDFGESLCVLPHVNPVLLADLYRRCTAVFHPALASPWSGPVRLALASGKPLVAIENSIIDAIAGPAAYLAPAGDARALGAALVTVAVEQQVAESLSSAALQRVRNWDSLNFGEQLLGIYRRIMAQ